MFQSLFFSPEFIDRSILSTFPRRLWIIQHSIDRDAVWKFSSRTRQPIEDACEVAMRFKLIKGPELNEINSIS
jgi:hypothetical protein